jgi:hypothetical protein
VSAPNVARLSRVSALAIAAAIEAEREIRTVVEDDWLIVFEPGEEPPKTSG